MADGYQTLTDKEKQTLRLILCGHDAKSMASALDLSIHTVNERLRNARRKLAVTSSKEAARVLLEEEGEAHQILVAKHLGDAVDTMDRAASAQPIGGPKAKIPLAPLLGGVLVMSILFAVLALGIIPSGSAEPVSSAQMDESELEIAARGWLELVDAGDAEASYSLTAHAFRALNTLETWQRVMSSVRTPLGATISRRLVSVQTPERPEGYTTVIFETAFAQGEGLVTETVILAQDDGDWGVVGIVLE